MGCNTSQVLLHPSRNKLIALDCFRNRTSSSYWAVLGAGRALKLRTWSVTINSSTCRLETSCVRSSKEEESLLRPSIATWNRANSCPQNWWCACSKVAFQLTAIVDIYSMDSPGIRRTGISLKNDYPTKLSSETSSISTAPPRLSSIAWPKGLRLVAGLTTTQKPWKNASLPSRAKLSQLWKPLKNATTASVLMPPKVETKFTPLCEISSLLLIFSLQTLQKCCLFWVVLAQERERNSSIT